MVQQYSLTLPAYSRGFHLISHHVAQALDKLPDTGMINIFLHHTSAALLINENADPSVRIDLDSSYDHLVPERMPFYTHTMEGDDDMPAHVKSALTGVSLTVPIQSGRMALGTWQGIFLAEFRDRGGRRRLTLTVYGE